MGFSLPFIKPFAITDDGEPAAGYQLFFYEVGTTDAKPTYADFDLTIPNANPIILDAAGRFPASVGSSLFLAGGPYKAVLKTPVAMGGATVWTVEKFSGTGSDSLLVVLNIADLKSLTPNSASQVMVLGYYTPGDRGGGVFLWNSGTSLFDDGIFVKPASILIGNPGRWERSFVGATNLLWWGARGDNVTSDTVALAAAINYATTILPPGQTIEITPSPTMQAYTFATIVAGLNAQGFTLKVLNGALLDFDLVTAIGCTYDSGPYRNFIDGSAQVTFNNKARLVQGAYAEWWGAVGDGVFDCEIALNKLFASTAAMYVLPNFFYLVVGAVVFPTTGTIYSYGKIQTAALAVQLDFGIYILNASGKLGVGDSITTGGNANVGLDVIAGGKIVADERITAGQAGAGLLEQRVGSGGTDRSPALSTYDTQVSAAGETASGAEDLLMVKDLDADSLVDDGDAIRISMGGTFASTFTDTDTVTLRVYLGGTLAWEVVLRGSNLGDGFTKWFAQVLLLKQSGNVLGSGFMITDGHDAVTLAPKAKSADYRSIAKTLTVLRAIEVKAATSDGADSITQNYMLLEYIKTK